jgi:hypothetical protein
MSKRLRRSLEEEMRLCANDADVGADREHPVSVPDSMEKQDSGSIMEYDKDFYDPAPKPKSPSQLKNHPLYTSKYNFVNPKLKVFTGMMFLKYDDENHGNHSSLATGAYCELCDTTLA